MKKNKNILAGKLKIGSNIRKWRNIKDVKQKDLAAILEISEAAVSNIENDMVNITITQLEDISFVLNVSIEQLLSDPVEKFRIPPPAIYPIHEKEDPVQLNRELLNAVIASLEKKDQQLQTILQNFLHTMSMLMQQEEVIFSPSKQATSRA